MKEELNMSEDVNLIIHEAYSVTEDYRSEVYQNSSGQFDLWIFKYDKKWDGYHILDDHRYLMDSLEEAIQKGDDLLAQLDPA